jgi:hypothetical protein
MDTLSGALLGISIYYGYSDYENDWNDLREATVNFKEKLPTK